jgi:hypothetical protein
MGFEIKSSTFVRRTICIFGIALAQFSLRNSFRSACMTHGRRVRKHRAEQSPMAHARLLGWRAFPAAWTQRAVNNPYTC